MKRLCLILIVFACFLQISAEKITTFTQLLNPKHLIVDNGQVIISDYPHIYMFSLSDFSLKKRLGGQGEGPGEFYIPQGNRNLKERGLVISVSEDYIVASSVGRVSFFNRDGDFIKLSKSVYNKLNAKFLYFKEKILGFMPRGEGKLIVSLFDPEMKTQNHIMVCDYWFNWTTFEPYNIFDRASDTLLVTMGDGKIFLTRGDSATLSVDAYNPDGKKLFTIKQDFKNKKISEGFKNQIHEHFLTFFKGKVDHKYLKGLLGKIPDVFPAVRSMYATDQNLFIITFKNTQNRTQVLMFSTDGKFLKEIALPVKERDIEKLFPFSIYDNTFYQLIENESSEKWELCVTPINPINK